MSQRQKRSRDTSEDDEAGDTGAARGSSRLAAGIDRRHRGGEARGVIIIHPGAGGVHGAGPYRSHGTPPHALREIDFFYFCPPDDAAVATAGSCAADQEELVDVALTLRGKEPLVAGREGTVGATLRLCLGPPSTAPDVAAALAEDDGDDLKLHLHGVPFSASTGPKLDPFWYPLPFAADHCNAPPPSPDDGGSFVVVPDGAFNSSFVPTGDDGFVVEFVTGDAIDRPSTVLDLNQPCSSEFPDDIAGNVVDERPGRVTAEQRHQSSTPYTFI